MTPILLVTFLSCKQVLGIRDRILLSKYLNNQQKKEIITELKKVVKSCPVLVYDDGK
jgi:hypothetical protein